MAETETSFRRFRAQSSYAMEANRVATFHHYNPSDPQGKTKAGSLHPTGMPCILPQRLFFDDLVGTQ